MSTVRKPFNKSEYEKYDQLAKDTVATYLEKMNPNYLIARNPNKYQADIILLERQPSGLYAEICLVEVESRPSWSGAWPKSWNYQIMQRKQKYQEQNLPVSFFTINLEQTHMIHFSDDLNNYPLIEKKNRLVKEGEFVFDIPVHSNPHVEIINLVPEKPTLKFAEVSNDEI